MTSAITWVCCSGASVCEQSCLRTITVFRSALLANLQYDQQKLSEKLEAIDSSLDIGEFIAQYSRRVHGACSYDCPSLETVS